MRRLRHLAQAMSVAKWRFSETVRRPRPLSPAERIKDDEDDEYGGEDHAATEQSLAAEQETSQRKKGKRK